MLSIAQIDSILRRLTWCVRPKICFGAAAANYWGAKQDYFRAPVGALKTPSNFRWYGPHVILLVPPVLCMPSREIVIRPLADCFHNGENELVIEQDDVTGWTTWPSCPGRDHGLTRNLWHRHFQLLPDRCTTLYAWPKNLIICFVFPKGTVFILLSQLLSTVKSIIFPGQIHDFRWGGVRRENAQKCEKSVPTQSEIRRRAYKEMSISQF